MLGHTLSLGGRDVRRRQPKGKCGDLVGRGSERSSARPVWGQRCLLPENRCVAVRTSLQDRDIGQQTETTPCLPHGWITRRPVIAGWPQQQQSSLFSGAAGSRTEAGQSLLLFQGMKQAVSWTLHFTDIPSKSKNRPSCPGA